MKSAILILCLILSLCSCSNGNKLLVEAESLDSLGGWVVDPQFVEQMGSPYLLAHGMGKVVENASGRVEFPESGKYHVWVRTKNWAPGDWDAPGKFRLIVDNKEIQVDLGTVEGWTWQYAGRLKVKETVSIQLKDLTGFEGRCDAIYFSSKKIAPPSAKSSLPKWRRTLTYEPNKTITDEKYDLVIVGGGIAGCAAAIAAAEMGQQVALIHDRPILGGNASSEIRVHTEGVTGDYDRILSMLNSVHWPNGSPDAVLDDQKRHKNIEKYESITLYLEYRAYNAPTEGDSIICILAKHTSSGDLLRLSAPVYIDCTGDGWIGYWAGAEYMYGREAFTEYDEAWDENGELWSPEEEDNAVMGSSVLWRTVRTDTVSEFPDIVWAKDIVGDFSATSGTWKWELSSDTLHQVDDAEIIRDHMFKAIYGSFANAKMEEGNQNLEMEWVSYLIGKRESRRLKGDYIFSFRDVVELRRFEDEVAYGVRPVDVHYQQNLLDPLKPDFLSEALFYDIDYYYIPFRSLYSKNIKNLMMAGRNFSCTHVGLGGPRVMNTTGQMGAATGFAAYLCNKYNTYPAGIYKNYIAELKDIIQKQK
ncbi:MAG: FAD-dependent oxidoreductase [Bacteroidales bacterium]|nr:FAD-dependent oxidoreductase [Bacteroidales bacterium]